MNNQKIEPEELEPNYKKAVPARMRASAAFRSHFGMEIVDIKKGNMELRNGKK